MYTFLHESLKLCTWQAENQNNWRCYSFTTVQLLQQILITWLCTLALQVWVVQKILKTTMQGVLLLCSMVLWEEGHL